MDGWMARYNQEHPTMERGGCINDGDWGPRSENRWRKSIAAQLDAGVTGTGDSRGTYIHGQKARMVMGRGCRGKSCCFAGGVWRRNSRGSKKKARHVGRQ